MTIRVWSPADAEASRIKPHTIITAAGGEPAGMMSRP